MPLVNTKKMFEMAYKNGYAVGAFNVNNMEITQGIIEAVAEEKAPLILQVSRGGRKYASLSYLKAIIDVVVEENPDIPIAINLDHGDTLETCKQFVDAGFTSVMIDASKQPFEENIKVTKQVVEYAHPRDVVVEAELGQLGGIEEDVVGVGVDDVSKHVADPEQVQEFVEKRLRLVSYCLRDKPWRLQVQNGANDCIRRDRRGSEKAAWFSPGNAWFKQRPERIRGPHQQIRGPDAECNGRSGGDGQQGVKTGHVQGQYRYGPSAGPDG